jgi:general L-amino acid transport system substrate-binding protein
MAKKSNGMRSLILSIGLVAVAFVSYLSIVNNGLTKDIAELREQVAELTAQMSEQVETPQAEAQPSLNESTDQQSTRDVVLARGTLIAGVNAALPGFGTLDTATGEFTGFDVDYARAIAAALGLEIEFIPLTAGERFTALQTRQIDVLVRNTTWTMTRDSQDVAADFGPTTFYDGQGFIVRIADGIGSLLDMDGATVCVTSGTTTEGNLADVFRQNGLELNTQVFSETEASFGAYEAGACDCYTSDKSQLASLRASASNPADHVILPDTISKEPLGPLTRHGDNEWSDIVRWVVYATFFAEEHGITQANVRTFDSEDPEVRRFLGLEAGLGAKLGLAEDWAIEVIAAVGNYGEIYDRHLGPDGLGIPRPDSLNALWIDGGLIYAPAWR